MKIHQSNSLNKTAYFLIRFLYSNFNETYKGKYFYMSNDIVNTFNAISQLKPDSSLEYTGAIQQFIIFKQSPFEYVVLYALFDRFMYG